MVRHKASGLIKVAQEFDHDHQVSWWARKNALGGPRSWRTRESNHGMFDYDHQVFS